VKFLGVMAKRLTFFLVLNLLLFLFTGPVVILYGPFKSVRSSIIGAILNSRHPHYITWLLSPEQLASILGPDKDYHSLRQDPFNLASRHHDDQLRFVEVKGARFQGYLLEVPDPTRVKLATARDIFEKGDTVSTIALNNNAIAAINAGGFHDPQGTGVGRLPYGVVIKNGRFVVGEDIKGPVDVVGLTKDGVLVTGKYTVEEMNKDENF